VTQYRLLKNIHIQRQNSVGLDIIFWVESSIIVICVGFSILVVKKRISIIHKPYSKSFPLIHDENNEFNNGKCMLPDMHGKHLHCIAND